MDQVLATAYVESRAQLHFPVALFRLEMSTSTIYVSAYGVIGA